MEPPKGQSFDVPFWLCYYGTFTQTSGYNLARQAIAEMSSLTAIFGANNFISIWAMKALRDMGFNIPGDISMVGFDDLPSTLVVDPFLTVAVQPAYEIGQKAAELLLSRLAENKLDEYQEVILPIQIIERRSSAGIRN